MALSELLVAAVVMGGLPAPAILLVVYLVHLTQRATGLEKRLRQPPQFNQMSTTGNRPDSP